VREVARNLWGQAAVVAFTNAEVAEIERYVLSGSGREPPPNRPVISAHECCESTPRWPRARPSLTASSRAF